MDDVDDVTMDESAQLNLIPMDYYKSYKSRPSIASSKRYKTDIDRLRAQLNLIPVDYYNSYESRPSIPSSKRYKTDIDRLSNLHDELIHHIFSFLPTKYIMQSHTLSRRWRNLGTNITVVNLSDTDNHNYVEFVNGVLNILNPSGRKFCFKFTEYYDEALTDAWIDAAIRLNAREIDIQVDNRDIFALPCKSPAILKLNILGVLRVSSFVDLPTLKTLYLDQVTFEHLKSIENLFSNSPNLEELFITSCSCLGDIINISSSTLKSLGIHGSVPECGSSQHKVVIRAPKLVYFKYNFANNYTLEGTSLLAKASIDIKYQWIKGGFDHHVSRIAKLLSDVSNVKSLELTSDTMVSLFFAIEDRPNILPRFDNLKAVELNGIAGETCIRSLLCLLNTAPTLESLVFSAEIFFGENNFFFWEMESVPQCLQSYMKTITVKIFHKDQNLEFVKFLVKNAQVLEKLTFILTRKMVTRTFNEGKEKLRKNEEEANLKKKLLLFPMASKSCEILFSPA